MRRAILVLTILAAGTGAAAAQQTSQGSEPPATFTEEFLHDEANIAAGGTIWADQCRHCHSAKAYPGKAPKLRPHR